MNEKLLHYIWKFQLFNKTNLQTTEGDFLNIIHPGFHNHDQGPDFSDARVHYDGKLWSGNVEIHVKSSDWSLHGHDYDDNYRNVILHVVWTHDKESHIGCPTLELKPLVPKILLGKYDLLTKSKDSIPCKNHLRAVDEIVVIKWKERMLAERLLQKAKRIFEYLGQNNGNWEESCWWLIARNFGNRVNADAFERIVKSIPFNVLLRHKHSLFQLEALLLGQAGVLNEKFTDKYATDLKTEFLYLRNKYRLKNSGATVMFLRMRPANFPTVRLVQLAAFLHKNESIFSEIIHVKKINEFVNMFDIDVSPYWQNHYRPGVEAPFKSKKPGISLVNQMVINSMVVMIFAFGHYHKNIDQQEIAMKWLEEMNAEINTICNDLDHAGFVIKTAYDSQSLMQLKENYCDQKRCLQCGIGNAIFSQG